MAEPSLGHLLETILIGPVAAYRRAPSTRQLINQAYARGGRTWKGAAAFLGVTESTLRRWRHGATPSGVNIQRIRAQAAELRRTRGALPVPATSTARIRFLFDGRYRDYPLANLKLDPAALRTAQSQLLGRDYDGATRTFLTGIRDGWYRGHFTAYEAQRRADEAAETNRAAAGPGGDIPDDFTDYSEDPDEYYDDLGGEDAYDEAIAENEKYTFAVGGFAR